jgi:hypothetical protein
MDITFFNWFNNTLRALFMSLYIKYLVKLPDIAVYYLTC